MNVAVQESHAGDLPAHKSFSQSNLATCFQIQVKYSTHVSSVSV